MNPNLPPDTDGVLERNVTTLLETGGEPPRISDAARARIRANLLAQHGAPARRRSPLLAIGLGLAATAAAAAIITSIVGGAGDRSGGGGGAASPSGEGKLADGTSWITEPGARVEVLASRRVRVTGAALLDVAPGSPFVVETAAGKIEVLGTRFLVDAVPQRTTAAVVRGSVKLASSAGDVVLRAGEQGVAEPGRPPTRGPAPRLSHLVSWAAQARASDGDAIQPLRNGTLFAREPNRPGVPEQPLPIQKLVVDVVVEDQVARVALDQTFLNPRAETLEGMYRFAIPPDASLQRLAMYVNGTLTESAVVERMHARRIYEDVVYRRLDPALLEWEGTGRLGLRVYPLVGREEKRLLLAYTQSLPKLYDDWTLEVPLPEVDLPVGELAFDVRLAGCANCEVSSTSHAIQVSRSGMDATVSYKQRGAKLGDSLLLRVRDKRREAITAAHTAGADRYVLVRARPELARTQRAYRPRTWVILDDVSASRRPMELRAQASLVDGLLRELDEDDRVAVIAFDVAAREKLPLTRVMDVDRAAVRRALKDEGGVGATSFDTALAAATKLLANTAPEDATIVYLGDGVVTSGARNLDALRAQLAGRAQFVGVGVGDGPDTQTLQALAAATGGYATTLDLADDLGWRAFDLVAALHTPRVTKLDARLVDATGAAVPATAYVKTPQLADGEELELVAKLASDVAPVAVVLTGTVDGAPWQQRIELAAAPRDGGYLPRLWAARHIAARLLAKHEPVAVPPCAAAGGSSAPVPPSAGWRGTRVNPAPAAATPRACQTEAEARAQRDEEIRKEVVALGKKYFLLSRHTSLLVLEDDAMYQRYGVEKGAGDTWAPYKTPSKIPVVKLAASVASGVPADAELVRTPIQVFAGGIGGFGDDVVSESRGPVARSRGGLGLIGTTTQLEANKLEKAAAVPLDEESPAASASAASEAAPAGADDDIAAFDKPSPEAVLQPQGQQMQLETKRATITTGALRGDAAGTGFGYGIGRGRFGGGGVKRRYYNSGYLSAIYPVRYASPSDAAYNDLTGFVPALFAGDFDAWRRELSGSERRDALHPIDDAAKALLGRARAAVPAGVYRWGDAELAVDAARRIGWRRTTGADLTETASFDGSTWTRRYAELGLDVTRALADDDVALALAQLPLWIAEPAHYARWFEVRATGPRQVTLAVPAAGKGGAARPALVLDFDAQDHLVSISSGADTELVRIAWTGGAPSAARIGGEDVAVGFTGQAIGDAVVWAHGTAAAPDVIVELPGRMPAYWAARLAQLAPGSAEWRHAQRQRMAALVGVGDRMSLFAAYEELRQHGGVSRGDLVLAGYGITAAASDKVAAALAPHRAGSGDLVRYFEASRAYLAAARPEALKPATTAGFLGALWSLREVTALAGHDRGKAAAERFAALGARAPELRLIGAGAIAQQYSLDPADAARAWDSVATGKLRNIARAQAALVFANRGRVDEAAARVAALVADLDLRADPPELAAMQYQFQASRRGQAGWNLVWAQWRDKVLAGDRYEHVLALLPAARQQAADIPAILARAVALANGDRERLASLAQLALGLGHAPFAQSIVDPLVKQQPTRELHQLAAQFALAQGRTAEALAHLEAAQDAAADEEVALSTVRGELTQILALARQVAVVAPAGSAQRGQAVATAMTWGRRWRAIDPDNPAIDQALGELQLAVGDRAEAWRQLSSVIERAPMSGDGYQTVAGAFEQQGRVAEALEYWQQAIIIDQTNPTPRLRKAQALIALGRTEEGDRLLAEISGRRWHERYEWIASQARSLLARGRAGRGDLP